MSTKNHVWNFATIGGVKRVNLESGADLVHLHELDQKLWTALSCPADDLEIDKRTLELVDEDKDGHIRVPEVLAAVKWILSVVRNPDDLLRDAATMPLSAISDSTEQGRALLESAKAILSNLGKGNQDTISAEDTADMNKIFAGTHLNGDGIITAETAGSNAALSSLIEEIIKCCGSVTDRNGKPGVNADLINAFFAACEQYAAWIKKSEDNKGDILPLGDGTGAAHGAYVAVRAKIEDYFIRCRLAAFDKQTTDALNLQTERVRAISDKDLSASMDEIAGYPLAAIGAGAPLPLSQGVNPAWEARIKAFAATVVTPLLGAKDTLTAEDWATISAKFAAYEQWQGEKQGTTVEGLGIARVQQILSSDGKTGLLALVEQDNALAAEAGNILLVDKMVHYYCDIFKLLKNFVTFRDFYTPGSKAVFQVGTLYIDQRSCELCIKVRNMGKQAELAQHSGMYLIYCDCVSRSSAEKMTIVVALTNGDIDDLMVGRNALFYDRNGLDWDATIVKITENPTSIRQAFFAPYRRVSKFVEAQINKAASAADEKSTANMTKEIENTPTTVAATQDEKAKKEPSPSFDVAKFAGIFAAIGLAVGAIGTMITAFVTGFLKLKWWQMPLAVAGLLLLISGPSMILAYMKLRKRNLAPILDANGWAINARLKINIPFGRTLTHLATLPSNARINFNDPFASKKSPVGPILLVLAVIAVTLYLLWKYKVIHLPF